MIINEDITNYVSSFLFQKVYGDDGSLNLKIGNDMIYLNQHTKNFLGYESHIKDSDYFLIKDDGENYILVKDFISDINFCAFVTSHGCCITLLYYYNKQQKKITHVRIGYRVVNVMMLYLNCNVGHRLNKDFARSFFKYKKNKDFYMKFWCEYDVHSKVIHNIKCNFENKFKFGEMWCDTSFSEYFNCKMDITKKLCKNSNFLKNISAKTLIECEHFIIHNIELCENLLQYLVA